MRAFRNENSIKNGTRYPKIDCENKTLQWTKSGSSPCITGPAHVLAVEVFGGRSWQPAISTGGVVIEVSRLRCRALVDDSGTFATPGEFGGAR